MRHSEEYSFNILGLILCALHIRWQRRRHYFCSQFVSEVLEQSGALALPKDSTLMHPNDYPQLPQLKCLYKGRLADLPPAQGHGSGRNALDGQHLYRPAGGAAAAPGAKVF